jgi:hypothetical protein
MNPLHGELIDFTQGVQAKIEAGVGYVIIETDEVAVVQVWWYTPMRSAMTNLITELPSLLSLNFISWLVQRRPRSCNRVAHELLS